MTIQHLVFSGGGPNVLSQFGAMKELINSEVLYISNIKHIYATSAGTLLALLLVIGSEMDDIETYLINKPWDKAFEKYLNNIIEIDNHKGLINHNFLLEILKTFFESKDVNIDITFKELYDNTGIELYFYATNLNTFSLKEFSYVTEPDMSIMKASIISSSLPPVLGPVKYNDNYYIDGGVFNNYPINSCLQNKDCKQEDILGLTVVGKYNYSVTYNTLEDDSFLNYMSFIIKNLVFRNMTDDQQCYIKKQIVIKPTYELLSSSLWDNFSKDKEFRKELVNAGVNSAKEFIMRI